MPPPSRNSLSPRASRIQSPRTSMQSFFPPYSDSQSACHPATPQSSSPSPAAVLDTTAPFQNSRTASSRSPMHPALQWTTARPPSRPSRQVSTCKNCPSPETSARKRNPSPVASSPPARSHSSPSAQRSSSSPPSASPPCPIS